MLEFLRNYGAMDNDENKLLASESISELNRLLFTQGTGSAAEPQALERHKTLFLTLIEECIQNIDSLVLYILRMYCIKTISCTFGPEFYLRIYGTGLIHEIQNRNGGAEPGETIKNSYSYTSSYEDEAVLSLENLIPGLNSCLRDFLSQCPSLGGLPEPSQERESGPAGMRSDTDHIYSQLSGGLSTHSQLEAELNREYLRSLELLWLSHIFELSVSKAGLPSFAEAISPLFEYDFEILDELRRGSHVSDRYLTGSDGKAKITVSDTILYFITQFLPNRRLMQHKVLRDLTLLSTLGSEDVLVHQKEREHSQGSKTRGQTKSGTLESCQNHPISNTSGTRFAECSSDHHAVGAAAAAACPQEAERLSGSLRALRGISGSFDYSSISRQLTRGPPRIVSKIIKNSNSGQRKIKSIISRSLYS
ncbi:hypothetical protein OIY81_3689 [Cryptosporidium canis]|nr:hypothetical protein OIY81_3689 [Cryptosporidium canis]